MQKTFRFVVLAAAALMAFGAHATPVNLVTNGDFEAGNFSGWTKSGNTSLSDVIANSVTSNHTYVWRSGATGSAAVISQQLATTVGATYDFSFDLYSAGTSSSNPSAVAFSASFGGSPVYSFTNTTMGWTHFDFGNLHATSALTELMFSSRNDPSFTRLDNVKVVQVASAVPEPESYALMLGGLGAIVFVACRRKIG